ncbi:uncharacterized protein F5891DRAFT_1204180 [Suillus fuscotomentosus]|uniref:Uncharacterized protein n=1 Tax=Suillus fuscotomentosus TaxID=1912939 RepID=A0AAD4DMJ9_9AGAM|nr:uncharacterized protein F5891DRAFT_1204180 [Suillus fuscotomentosus]KAG1881331.1 hypothetical protein F5891DRAFT_1204180 [Suillus fuscotomentosus]
MHVLSVDLPIELICSVDTATASTVSSAASSTTCVAASLFIDGSRSLPLVDSWIFDGPIPGDDHSPSLFGAGDRIAIYRHGSLNAPGCGPPLPSPAFTGRLTHIVGWSPTTIEFHIDIHTVFPTPTTTIQFPRSICRLSFWERLWGYLRFSDSTVCAAELVVIGVLPPSIYGMTVCMVVSLPFSPDFTALNASSPSLLPGFDVSDGLPPSPHGMTVCTVVIPRVPTFPSRFHRLERPESFATPWIDIPDGLPPYPHGMTGTTAIHPRPSDFTTPQTKTRSSLNRPASLWPSKSHVRIHDWTFKKIITGAPYLRELLTNYQTDAIFDWTDVRSEDAAHLNRSIARYAVLNVKGLVPPAFPDTKALRAQVGLNHPQLARSLSRLSELRVILLSSTTMATSCTFHGLVGVQNASRYQYDTKHYWKYDGYIALPDSDLAVAVFRFGANTASTEDGIYLMHARAMIGSAVTDEGTSTHTLHLYANDGRLSCLKLLQCGTSQNDGCGSPSPAPSPPTPKPRPVPKARPVRKAPLEESTPLPRKKQKVVPPESPLTESELSEEEVESPVRRLPRQARPKASRKTTASASALKKKKGRKRPVLIVHFVS